MKNKKYIGIIGVIIFALIIGCIFLHISKNRSTSSSKPIKQAESLEKYDSSPGELVDEEFIDESETCDTEAKKALEKEIMATLDEYYGTIFNFDQNTKDFSEALAGFYGTEPLFDDGNKNDCKNIYPEFQGVNMNSKYNNYHILSMVNRDTPNPEVSVIGLINADFSNDKVEKGTYDVLSNIILIKVDGVWKIYSDQTTLVMKAGTIKAYKDKDYPISYQLNIQGDQVMSWDFTNVEGFLTDYSYGQEWSGEEVEVTENQK